MSNKTRELWRPESKGPQLHDWLGPVRMLVIAFIAFGYASTMPRGQDMPEYLRMFGYDPSWYGIAVLFMMSGWLALRSLERHGSALKFLISRLGRNLPILVIFAASVPLILFPLFATPVDAGTSRVDQHLQYFLKVVSCVDPNTLTPGLLDNALYMCIIQGGLWTFRWGMIAFLATALLWVIGGLRDRRLLLLYTITCLVSYVGLVTYGVETPDHPPLLEFVATGLRLALMYLGGMCAYAYRHKLMRSLLIPAGLLAATLVQYFMLPWTPLLEVFASVSLGYLAYLGVTSERVAPNWVKKMPDLSLGLYVLNWPAAQLVLLNMPGISPLALFGASFSLSALLAFVLWTLVSRKINVKLSTLTGLRTA